MTILYDYIEGTNQTSDYCLGQYYSNNNTIQCVTFNLQTAQANKVKELTFRVPGPGDYAVIYYPAKKKDFETITCDIICQNYDKIIIYLPSSLVFLMIVAYIFYKVFILLTKLKQTKKREAKFEANLKYINSM